MKYLKTQPILIYAFILISLLTTSCQQQAVNATSSVSINDFPTPTKSSEVSIEQSNTNEELLSSEQNRSEDSSFRNSMWNMSEGRMPIQHTGKIKNIGDNNLTLETDGKTIEIKTTDRTRITITKLLSTKQLIKEVDNNTVERISVSYERSGSGSLTAKHIILLPQSRQQNNPSDTTPPGRGRWMDGGQGMSEEQRAELQRRFQEGMSEEQRAAQQRTFQGSMSEEQRATLQRTFQGIRESRTNQTTDEEQEEHSTRPLMGNISKIDTKELVLETDNGPITVGLADTSLISKTSSSLLTDLQIDTTISVTGLAVDENTNLIEAISVSLTPPEIQALRMDRGLPPSRTNH